MFRYLLVWRLDIKKSQKSFSKLRSFNKKKKEEEEG
jgi:hypothetical protein